MNERSCSALFVSYTVKKGGNKMKPHSDHSKHEVHSMSDHSEHDIHHMNHSSEGHGHHEGGGMHAHHHHGDFKKLFFRSLPLGIVVLVLSPMMDVSLPFQFTFPYSDIVAAVFATILL